MSRPRFENEMTDEQMIEYNALRKEINARMRMHIAIGQHQLERFNELTTLIRPAVKFKRRPYIRLTRDGRPYNDSRMFKTNDHE